MVNNKIGRTLLTAAGYLCVALGVIGAFLPILPTTPFILLAAWLFYRSSPRARAWLMSHRIFGKIVENYMEGRGIPLHAKIISISVIWLSMAATILLVGVPTWVDIVLIVIAVGTTIHISRFKTIKR